MIRKLYLALPMAMILCGCGDSGSAPATATAPATNTADRIKQDLSTAGHELHDVTTQAAQEVKPALEKAKDQGRQAIHDVAVKIAEQTATQSAPTTTPQ
jgi:predicted trehalose synthase